MIYIDRCATTASEGIEKEKKFNGSKNKYE